MSRARIVGVIPAAGHATRLQPLRCSKEVLEIGGRPLIDYVAERMRATPVDELRVVTRPDKEDVADHARSLGATVIVATPETLPESILHGARGLAGDTIVLVGFPDTIWEPPDGFRRLVAALTGGVEVSLGLFRFAEPERCDAVSLTTGGVVKRIEVKARRPSSDLVWGAAAIRARALRDLDPTAELGRSLGDLARTGRVVGLELSQEYVDLGTKSALAGFSRRAGT